MAKDSKLMIFAVKIALAVLAVGLLVFFGIRESGPRARFEAIPNGMSKQEVLERLGEPDHGTNDLDGNTVYFYGDFSGGRWITLKVTIDSGDIVIGRLDDY